MRTTMKQFVIIGSVLAAGLGTAGAAVAAGDASTAQQAQPSTETTTEPKVSVEVQRGIVLEGTGALGEQTVMVTVYENSLYGNSVQVVLGDPDEGHFGYAEQAEPFVVDGVLRATVEIDGQTAELAGTVVPTGRATRLIEPYQDAGEQIVDKGTHTLLVTDVTITYAGTTGPLEFAPAFAYDLESRKVVLHGN